MSPRSASRSATGLLIARLPTKYVKSLVDHFEEMLDEIQRSEWESATIKSGKFVEAVLKALWAHLGHDVPKSKDFKVDVIIRQLEQTPSAHAEDTVRLTIPRACRFVYEVASNRGARHDPDEINPNEMDSSAVVAIASWIMAELLRYSQKGAVDMTVAQEMVTSLSQKRFAPIEEVDGHVYFHFKGLSAREVALLTLWRSHPRREHTSELAATAERHGFSSANARMGVTRLAGVVDDDGHGHLRLLAPGLNEAQDIFAAKKLRFD